MKWILSLLLLPSFCHAQKLLDWAPQFQTKFCGLDTLHDSSLIDDCDAQAAQNVLTDRGYLEERTGNLRLTTILNGFPIKQVYEYVSPANTRFVIAHASNSVYQTNLAGMPVAISTIAANQNLECTNLYGVLICDDGSGTPWSFNGTSTSPIYGGMPICNLLASEYGRVFCGAPSTDLSQVAISSFGGFNYWTPSTIQPLPANVPNSFEFNPNDGDQILCMKTTPWGLFVGKKNSSYLLKGYDNATFFVQTLDPNIGCIDQRTVQVVNGLLTWASLKGVYQWPGQGPPVWISEKIDPTYRGIRQLTANSNFWQLQTQADFLSGTFTTNGPKNTWDANSVPGFIIPSSSTFQDSTSAAFSSGTIFINIDTTTVPNQIQLSTFSFYENFNDCAFNTPSTRNPFWTYLQGNTNCSANVGPNGSCELQCAAPAANTIIFSSSTISTGTFTADITAGGGSTGWVQFISSAASFGANGYAMRVDNVAGNITPRLEREDGGAETQLCACTPPTNPNPATYQVLRTTYGYLSFFQNGAFCCAATDNTYNTSKNILFQANNSGANVDNISFWTYATSGTFQSRIFDTQFSTPTYGVLNATFSVASNNITNQTSFFLRESTSPNNDMWSAYVASSDTLKTGLTQKRYTQYEVIFANFVGTTTPSVSNINYTAISTGIYYSPLDFIGTKITSWKQFNITDFQQTPGQFQYYVRSASYSFTPLQTTPGWVAQNNNQTVVVATGTFFEWKVDSSSITSSSQAITTANAGISKSIVNWQEGSSAKPASGFMDQRYFLCVTLSTSNLTNDGCLVFQRNRNWTLLSGPSISAMSPFNSQLIGGDGSSASRVWYMMQDGIYDDDGSVINSSWTTKDFIVGSPFNQKIFYEIWTDNQYSQGADLNIGWSLDKNPLFTSKTINLDNTSILSTNVNTVVSRTYPDKGTEFGKYIRFNFSQNQLDLPWRLNSWLFYVDVQLRQGR